MIGSPPLEGGPLEGVTVDIDLQIREYLEAMGWNPETGVPEKDTLTNLGLDFVAAENSVVAGLPTEPLPRPTSDQVQHPHPRDEISDIA